MADADPIRAELERLVASADEFAADGFVVLPEDFAAARAALAAPKPPSPASTEGDVEDLVAALDQDGHHLVEVAMARECSKTWGLATRVVRAAALLRQLAAQAQPPQPAHPIRDAAERLLRQLELWRTDPSAPTRLELAEIALRQALDEDITTSEDLTNG